MAAQAVTQASRVPVVAQQQAPVRQADKVAALPRPPSRRR
jgi:hypothetical protein